MASKSVNPTLFPIGGMHLVYISHLGAEKWVRSVIRLQEWDFDLTVTAINAGANSAAQLQSSELGSTSATKSCILQGF